MKSCQNQKFWHDLSPILSKFCRFLASKKKKIKTLREEEWDYLGSNIFMLKYVFIGGIGVGYGWMLKKRDVRSKWTYYGLSLSLSLSLSLFYYLMGGLVHLSDPVQTDWFGLVVLHIGLVPTLFCATINFCTYVIHWLGGCWRREMWEANELISVSLSLSLFYYLMGETGSPIWTSANQLVWVGCASHWFGAHPILCYR